MITNILRVLMARSMMPFIFSGAHNSELNIDVENIGLYFHIPFCRVLCPFCPYYKIKYNRELLGEFSSSLLKEIRLVAAFIERRKEVGSIYFGGGTPALAIDYLPEVINLTKSLFDVKGDMGIELHPGDVNPTLLEKLKKIRFNMISLGIQSFKDTCLSVLERDRIDNFKYELYFARKLGYIEKYDNGYILTEKGAYSFHLIEQAYTRQYIDKTWRCSLNNPWPKRIALY